ncbi:hypothetical protein [Kaistia sp. MMO-174]|uniref:hypothetical protein n=1 Tax=Kaistia sp. MMO-174 TaxID=3081256 RepID=UPI003016720A
MSHFRSTIDLRPAQTDAYRSAVMEALERAGGPQGVHDEAAAIAALAAVQGHLIGKIRDREARRAMQAMSVKVMEASTATFVAQRIAGDIDARAAGRAARG